MSSTTSRESRLAYPARTVRWVVLAFVALEFGVGVAESPMTWWSLSFSVLSAVATITSLFRTQVGFALSLILLASPLFVDERAFWVTPMIVTTLIATTTGTPRLVGVVLTIYATGLVGLHLESASGLAGFGLILLILCAAIGLAVRHFNLRRDEASARISGLGRTIIEARVLERRELAEELSHLLGDVIAQNQRAIRESSKSTDPARIGVALRDIERDARSALGWLRQLVSILRSPDGGSVSLERAPISEVVEAVDEELTSHAFWVDGEVDPAVDSTLDPPAWSAVARCLRHGAEHMRIEGVPGGHCSVLVGLRDHECVIAMTHETHEAGLVSNAGLRSLGAEFRRLGGWLTTEVVTGDWRLRASVPAHHVAASDTSATRDVTPTGSADATRDIRRGRLATVASVLSPALVVTLVGLAGAVRSAVSVFSQMAAGGEWAESAVWLATWLAIAAYGRSPRVGAWGVAASMIAALFISPASALLGAPPHWQIVVLAVMVTLRRPRWTLALVVSWMGYVLVWFRGVLDQTTLATVMYAVPGVAIGLQGRYFLQMRRRQQAEITRLERERVQAAERERMALAGELHDVVAHQLSAMGLAVSANATSTDLTTLQATAERVARINDSARADLTTLVNVMREGQAGDSASPSGAELTWSTPTVTARAVAQTLIAGGHRVEVNIDEGVDECDPTTQRTVGRILRESTTNILRYAAPDCDCRIVVGGGDETVSVIVGSALPEVVAHHPDSSGLGLIGLAERVELTGGVFRAGRVLDQWRVIAELPRFAGGEVTHDPAERRSTS